MPLATLRRPVTPPARRLNHKGPWLGLLCALLLASCAGDPEANDVQNLLDVGADSHAIPDGSVQPDQMDLQADQVDLQQIDVASVDAPGDTDLAPDALVAAAPLKVMSFNLRTGFAFDEEDSWKNRETIVTDFLKLELPDLVGTQEGLIFQLDAITAALPNYDWVGVGRDNTQFEEFCAIFFNTDKFQALESGTFWLSDTPDVPGTKFSDKQGYLRIVTWAHLQRIEDGFEFFHFNTHYDLSEEDSITERSSALILTKMDQLAGDGPVFLTGDFNEFEGEPAYQILVGEADWQGISGDLLDPWTELGLPSEGSFHSFTGVAEATTRIDWILHSTGFIPIEAVVSHYNQDGHYPSDHFPIWARLETP